MAGRPRKAAAAAATTDEVGERWTIFNQWLKDNGHGDHDAAEMKLAVQKYVKFQASDENRAFNAARRGSDKADSAASASVPSADSDAPKRGRGRPRKAAAGPSEDAASRPAGGRGARKTTAGRRGSRTAASS